MKKKKMLNEISHVIFQLWTFFFFKASHENQNDKLLKNIETRYQCKKRQ